MNFIPTPYEILRHMDETKVATGRALVAQYEVGYQAGKRETWVLMGALGMCCFIGGGVFVAFFSHIVIGALT